MGVEACPAGLAQVLLRVALHARVVPVLHEMVGPLVILLARAPDLEVNPASDHNMSNAKFPAVAGVAKT